MTQTRRMTFGAVMIGLSTVLSFVRVYDLPLGGSITLLSMLPVCMVSVCYGVKWGLFCAVLYAGAQIGVDLGKLMGYGFTPAVWVGSLLFDYLFAFGSLGLAGLFRKKRTLGMCAGIALSMAVRFVSHFISGVILFGAFTPEGWNVYLYSLCYNGSYMLPELVITLVGAGLVLRLPQIRKLIQEKQMIK